MASEDSFLVLVHHRGSIKKKTRSGIKFTDKDPLCIIVRPTTNYDALVSSVLEKLGLEGVKRVKKFYYRIPTTVLHIRQFSEVRTPELLAKLVDVVSSSGGSNRNANTIATVAGSSSRPAVASSSVPVYEPAIQPVASPSFAVDLTGNVGDEVRCGEHHPTKLRCPTLAGVGEGLFDDPDDDDVEPDMIADDSGDDLGARTSSTRSISGTRPAPLCVASSGIGIPLGSPKYISGDRNIFPCRYHHAKKSSEGPGLATMSNYKMCSARFCQ
ncbi:hypothetical protein Ahy_B05g078668 [Arachis hypogaea]|uniref:Uncharacterized protein n=1 Tax=Arachis hypogaea TaxID=3818 RepID=A0A444Z7N2_ARAHY|nr:hypothetical protein Ahy_B05g078668 [Arachis hypogaea]